MNFDFVKSWSEPDSLRAQSVRRLKMLRMLAMGYSPSVVVETLCKENDCTPQVIYRDYANMHVWAHVVVQDKLFISILRARLDLINSEVLVLKMENTELQLNSKDRFVKLDSVKSALKGMVEQIRLVQELVLVERKPLDVESANKKVVIRMWRPNDESNRNSSKVLPVPETKNLPQRPIQDTP
jgi:hypothetical protein